MHLRELHMKVHGAGYPVTMTVTTNHAAYRWLDFDQMTQAPGAPGGCADGNWCAFASPSLPRT